MGTDEAESLFGCVATRESVAVAVADAEAGVGAEVAEVPASGPRVAPVYGGAV